MFSLALLTSVAQFPTILSHVVLCGEEMNVLASRWLAIMRRWYSFFITGLTSEMLKGAGGAAQHHNVLLLWKVPKVG